MWRYGVLAWIVCCGLLSCEDPNISIDRLDPALEAIFIDVDSLVALDSSIAGINNEISLVNDSLEVIDSLEIAGDPTDYSNEIASLNEALDNLQEERSELNDQRRDVAAGNILINAITAINADDELIFTEPRASYRLPLNPRSSVTEFEILYRGSIKTAQFTYDTDTLFINRTVRIIAKNMALTGTSYDSARFTCDTLECTSVNAKAVFYL